MLYIHPDECVDCGACEPVCPVEAIFYEDDTPEQWKDYYHGQRRLLRRPRLARWRGQGRRDRQGPPAGRGAAAAGARRVLSGVHRVPSLGRSARLPDFPWDPLAPYAAAAAPIPDGIVDLSVGTPVDPTPPIVQDALADGRRRAGLPAHRRSPGAASRAGRLAGPPARRAPGSTRTRVLPTDRLQGAGRAAADPARPRAGRPGGGAASSPTRRTRSVPGSPARTVVRSRRADRARPAAGPAGLAQLAGQPDRAGAPARAPAKVVDWARERGAVRRQRRVLPRARLGGRAGLGAAPDGVAAAATRACSRCTRCPSGPTSPATGPASSPATRRLVAALLAVRKHAGLIVPAPVQAAMVAAFGDETHVDAAAGPLRRPA